MQALEDRKGRMLTGIVVSDKNDKPLSCASRPWSSILCLRSM